MVIPEVVHSPITCFGSILQCDVFRAHRETIAAQHAGVERQRTLQQRLAAPDDGQELPCPRLTSLQLKSQFQFTLHKLQYHHALCHYTIHQWLLNRPQLELNLMKATLKLFFRQVFDRNQ
jgi:hypothetical protein